jgi:hypothetical protein
MTPEDRRHAIQVVIGARLALEAADQCIKRTYIGYGRVSPPTVAKVLRGQNCKVSTLFEVADALNCDVEITIHKRTA